MRKARFTEEQMVAIIRPIAIRFRRWPSGTGSASRRSPDHLPRLAGVFLFQLTSLRNLGSSLEACLCGPSQLIARAVSRP
jgi:hypothetical protein